MPDPDVVDGAILSNAGDHLQTVFRAPDRPARTIPASTIPATNLSNADPASDLSDDSGTSGAPLHGDCLDVMARLPDSCFRAVVTSPPYNLRNSSGNGMRDGRSGKWEQASLRRDYATHTDAMPHSAYVGWQRRCLAKRSGCSGPTRSSKTTNGGCRKGCFRTGRTLSRNFRCAR